MLLCNEAKLLSSWKPRIGYSQNVMDILTSYSKTKSRQIKTKKGTVWNLEKVGSNHIEIKSMGGKNYHKEVKKLLKEFSAYAQYFDETLQKDDLEHKQLFENHKKMIDTLQDDVKATFISALSASGILPNKA
jgi:predicted HNH restriction endonuclease